MSTGWHKKQKQVLLKALKEKNFTNLLKEMLSMAFNKSLAGYFDDLAHVGIPTDDMNKTIAFWEKLGFKKQGQFDTDDQGHQVTFMNSGH